eukprot:g3585.t1
MNNVTLDNEIAAAGGKLVVLFFWADFDPASKAGGQMDLLTDELKKKYSTRAVFLKIEAESSEELAERFALEAVPHFVFLQNGKEVDSLTGAEPSALLDKVEKHLPSDTVQAKVSSSDVSLSQLSSPSSSSSSSNEALDRRIAGLISSNRIMLFMKGTQNEPKCKFSRKVCNLLKEAGVVFGSFNILEAPDVRARIKIYSNWKTFPQLYVGSKLIGGADIIEEMAEDGELEELAKVEPPLPPSTEATNIALSPEEVLNIRLKKLIGQSSVMLFMKGNPDEPRCGFSRKIVSILRENGVTNFGYFDILSDEEVRQGLKTFSNWPTYPQLYHNSKLIGGLDVIQDMAEDGELAELVE